MRHVRMLGLCLVAVFAVAAVVATSASALPEWGQCFKKGAGGKFTDENCTKKASLKTPGEFEWRKSAEVKEKAFEGHNVGSGGVLSTALYYCENGGETIGPRKTRKGCEEAGGKGVNSGVAKVECESEVNHGEAAGSKEVKNVIVDFKGCTTLGGNIPCSNTPSEGEIQVNPLKGSLGYINKSKKEVGVLLEPSKAKGEFASFSCAGVISTVVGVGNIKEGSFYLSSGCYGLCPEATPTEEAHGGYDGIISPITPINQMATEFTQTYTINEATFENIPNKFEGKHIDLLEDYVFNAQREPEHFTSRWSPAGETITNVNHQVGGEAVEIKA